MVEMLASTAGVARIPSSSSSSSLEDSESSSYLSPYWPMTGFVVF
jgi:hypothetical protein